MPGVEGRMLSKFFFSLLCVVVGCASAVEVDSPPLDAPACASAIDCPADPVCADTRCDRGVCVVQYNATDLQDTLGDCLTPLHCNDIGVAIYQLNLQDLPAPMACLIPYCDATGPSYKLAQAGSHCDGGVCNDAGMCLGN